MNECCFYLNAGNFHIITIVKRLPFSRFCIIFTIPTWWIICCFVQLNIRHFLAGVFCHGLLLFDFPYVTAMTFVSKSIFKHWNTFTFFLSYANNIRTQNVIYTFSLFPWNGKWCSRYVSICYTNVISSCLTIYLWQAHRVNLWIKINFPAIPHPEWLFTLMIYPDDTFSKK